MYLGLNTRKYQYRQIRVEFIIVLKYFGLKQAFTAKQPEPDQCNVLHLIAKQVNSLDSGTKSFIGLYGHGGHLGHVTRLFLLSFAHSSHDTPHKVWL